MSGLESSRDGAPPPAWRLALWLTLGLLAWELGLWSLGPENPGSWTGVFGNALRRDAALLWLVGLVAVGFARRAARSGHSRVQVASVLTLSFLALMTSVAVGRGLLQRRAARPTPPARSDEAVSATAEFTADERRFLCAAVSADGASAWEDPDGGSWETAVGRGLRDALLLQVPLLPLALGLLPRPGPLRPGACPRRPSPLALSLLLGTTCVWESDETLPGTPGPSLPASEGGCPVGAPERSYAVAAISTDLVLNAAGDHLPGGFAYVLDEPGSGGEPLQPLVLRANLGDCLRLQFTNRLTTQSAALRIEGLPATVRGASPMVGFLPPTLLAPGQRLTSVLALPEAPEAEGAYLLHDSTDGGEREARGLFGALVLEPGGARYREASPGAPLRHGTGGEALIEPATGPGFHERVLLFHALGPPETADVRSARGTPLPVLDEMAGPFRAGAFGLSYRSEPHFDRQEAFTDEEEWHPAPAMAAPLFRSSLGEAVKLRVVHAGSAELHIPHVHGWDEHRGQRAHLAADTGWEQPRLLAPGGSFTLAATGTEVFPPAAGDFLIHCHMPNHSTGGERLTWRVVAGPPPLPRP